MAIAWSPECVEGEGETAVAGESLPGMAWSEESCGEIEGFLVRVLICAPLLKVVALKKGVKFEAEFDSVALASAGMDARLALDDYIDTLRSALLAERSEVSSKVLADASAVVWIVTEKMGRRTFEYRLELLRVDLHKSDSLRLELDESQKELDETKQQLAESRALVAEMQQINEELMQRMDTVLAKGDATQKQLAASKTEIEALRTALVESKAEITELIAGIRVRNAHISDLDKVRAKAVSTVVAKSIITSAQFLFDTSIKGGFTKPRMFQVAADGKNATAKRDWSQILLKPAVTTNCQLTIVVEKMTRWFYVGITDDYSKCLYSHGCAFYSSGNVWVNGTAVAKSQPFGGWQTGDRLLLKAQLSSGTVTIESRTGEFTVEWTPRSSPRWFSVRCSKGTALRID